MAMAMISTTTTTTMAAPIKFGIRSIGNQLELRRFPVDTDTDTGQQNQHANVFGTVNATTLNAPWCLSIAPNKPSKHNTLSRNANVNTSTIKSNRTQHNTNSTHKLDAGKWQLWIVFTEPNRGWMDSNLQRDGMRCDLISRSERYGSAFSSSEWLVLAVFLSGDSQRRRKRKEAPPTRSWLRFVSFRFVWTQLDSTPSPAKRASHPSKRAGRVILYSGFTCLEDERNKLWFHQNFLLPIRSR